MKGQSKEARRTRMAAGRCPTHGIKLQVAEVSLGIVQFRCPRRYCRTRVLLPAVWVPLTTVKGKWELAT